MRPLVLSSTVLVAVLFSSSALASTALEPTHISLPSGPGSIEGLGRNFTPSLSSGTASYGVDIAVPPSAGGFAPHLSLEYDSGGGVTDVGMGWRLAGLPTVRRRTENGLPRFTGADPFEVTGMGIPCDLLQVSPGTFRPEYESGAFLRVQQSGTETWQLRDKSGMTWNLGGSAAFEEAEGTNVATYLPSEALDLHGHRIAFTWDTSSGAALLEDVVWNDFGDSARNEILVSYEARPDVHVLFGSGIRQTLDRRMTAIEVRHGGQLVRRYVLTYGADAHSRLATVTLVGRDGVSKLPTLSFGYTPQALAATVVAMTNAPGRSPGDANAEISDLNGDGLPDFLFTLAGQYVTYVNQDGQSWLPEDDWPTAASPSLALGQIGVQLADLDGDGAIDLVAKTGTTDFRYFPGNTADRFKPPVQIATVPDFTFEDPDVKLADMDGDRLVDAVVTTQDGLAIGYNLGGVDWSIPSLLGPVDAQQPLRFSDGGHTQLCDVNGDRVEDFCYLTPGSLVYWLGRGRGAFEPAKAAAGVPTFDPSSPWELHDLNGDGWVDLVHVDPSQVELALATAAGQFGAPKTITTVPAKNPTTTIRYADMNASGTLDIVWVDVTGDPAKAWQYVELFPAGRAGLLQTVDNGLGRVTAMTYGPAALDAAAARKAGTPWTSRMNVAMPVVRSEKVDDSLGDPVMETDYSYANGTWSPVERTFAAFGGGTERALGDEYTPTLVTTSTFDVGLDDRTLRGSVLTTQSSDESGTIFTQTQTTWTTRTLATGMDGRTVDYSFKTSEQTSHVEGKDPSKARVTLVDWDQDAWGNVVVEHDWGEVVGGNPVSGNDEAVTLRTFANDDVDWVLGRLASEELQDAAGHRVRAKQLYYDGAAFQGLALGQVTRGDLSREMAWVGPGASDYELEGSTAYDADGNPVETKDARGGGRLMTWDSETHALATSETVKLPTAKLVETALYDGAFGTITSTATYDGQLSSYQYDAFGRLTAIVQPGDSSALPTKTFAYQEGAHLSRLVTERRIWAGRSDVEHTEDVYDGLLRKRASLTASDGGQWVLAGVNLLDARGETRRALRARFATASERSSPPLLAAGPGTDQWQDATARIVRTLTPAGVESRTAFLPLVELHWDGGQTDPTSPYEHTPNEKDFDGLGRLIATTSTLGGKPVSSKYQYDAAGDLVARIDPEGNRASYGYDGRGRRVLVDDPDGGKHAFVFDALGNVLEHHKPDGAVQRFIYDLANRKLSEDWDGDGTADALQLWDSSERAPGNPLYLGKLTKVSGPSGSTENEYDERQRVVATHHVVDGHAYDVHVAYDDQDREYWHQYPDGSSIRLSRNLRGQVSAYGHAVELTYDGDGLELRRAFSTGVAVTSGYDADRRHTEQAVTAADGSIAQHLRWSFDAASNIESVVDLRPGITTDRDRTEHYAYDNLYRLTDVRGTWGVAHWTYSPSGNLIERTSSLAALDAGAMSYGEGGGPHALTGYRGRAVTYDANGRMKSDGQRSYAWDADDHLLQASLADGHLAENAFDGEGTRRVRKEQGPDSSLHTTYFLDDNEEVEDGKLVRYIVHGGQRIARLADGNGAPGGGQGCAVGARSGDPMPFALWPVLVLGLAFGLFGRRARASARWVIFGVLAVAAGSLLGCSGPAQGPSSILDGTVQQLSAADELLFDDAIGTLTEQTDGDGRETGAFAAYPYGLTRYDTSPESRKYAKSPRDTGVGLDAMGVRFYAPELGVWTSADPVAFEEPEKSIGHPAAAVNPYSYAGLTPTVAADHDGRFWHIVAGAVIGAVVAGGIEAYQQYSEKGHIEDWGKVGMHAAVGGIGGALLAAAPGAGLPAAMALGGAEAGVEGMAHRLIDTGSVGSAKDVAIDVGVGALSAGLGNLAEGAVSRVLNRSAPVVVKEAVAAESGGFCFAAGTLVATPDGLRPIESIHAGDVVLSRASADGAVAPRQVAQTFVTEDAEVLHLELGPAGSDDIEQLTVTPAHPFWVAGGGWRPAGQLKPGDHVSSANGPEDLVVQASDASPAHETVFNLEVEDLHTYFVGHDEVWVHNTCRTSAPAAKTRPKFWKSTRENALSAAPKGADGKPVCPTCTKPIGRGTIVRGGQTRVDYDLDHTGQTWAQRRDAYPQDISRKEVSADYQRDVRAQCPDCNQGHQFEPGK